jgi:endonuclease/exonuclease/phosphatase family metal-dependent hydrolase
VLLFFGLDTGSKFMRLKVLSYNIHKGFDGLGANFVLHKIRQALRDTKCDILFLQEVVGENIRHKQSIKLWPTQSQFEFLADEFWPHFSYGQNAVFSGRDHGNAILSRFPIEKISNLDISNNRWERRGLQHAQVRIPELGNLLVNLFNTHLDLFEFNRRKQVKKIISQVKPYIDKSEPIILAGDFNDWTHNMCRDIQKQLPCIEAFESLYGECPNTFPNRIPFLSLDRIFLYKFNPIHGNVFSSKPWSHLSDHLPLFLEIESH